MTYRLGSGEYFSSSSLRFHSGVISPDARSIFMAIDASHRNQGGCALKRLSLLIGIAIISATYANDNTGDWSWRYKPLSATYSIYSGEPGERQPPTQSERKIAISIRGDAAKEIFDSLYPDAKDATCTDEKGERLRRRGEVWCSYRPSDDYRCFVGFNLRTGASLSGASC